MKRFKTQTAAEAHGRTVEHEITVESFSKATRLEFPFYQRDGKNVSLYGICPSCENPIQLIGLLKERKVAPYGRHAGKDVDGLPKWNHEKYLYCPYAEPGKRRKPSRDEEFSAVDEKTAALYNLLKNEFDSVVYVLEKTLHMKCSTIFWKKALDCFVANHFYCYPWLTEYNLPYIFAYWGMQQQNIYGQFFEPGTGAYNALAAQPGVAFSESRYYNGYRRLQNRGKGFLNLTLLFNDHKQAADEGTELIEQMQFYIVSDIKKKIYREIITFDQTYFQNIIRKENRTRRQDLLDYAASVMPPLEITE